MFFLRDMQTKQKWEGSWITAQTNTAMWKIFTRGPIYRQN